MNETLATVLCYPCYAYAGLPYDVVKLRLQTQGRVREYKGVTDALVRIARNEGIRSLGKGGTPHLAGWLLYTPLTSAFGRVSKKTVTMLQLQKAGREDGMTLEAALEASVTALAVSTATTVPENIACKLQFQRAPLGQEGAVYRGPLDCITKVFKLEGIPGLFRGYSSVLLRDVPATPIIVGVFHATTPITERVVGVGEENPFAALASTLLGTAAGVGLLYPADVVKSHMQTTSASNPLTLREGFRSVYAQHGLRGFYRGGMAAAMGGSISLTVFAAAFYAFMPPNNSAGGKENEGFSGGEN
ncbi:hypothetical protein V7S43_008877 [Phytophthora oleae]|uniref:Mitochondrial carrier protein n=1 Tax=Phytophthora oleae TaxID=2107226 RepID=A0ABD3FK36_9STRA